MSYMVMSMIVWVIMNALGEMTTYLPVKGVSIPYFVNRFAEPSLAFAVGMILVSPLITRAKFNIPSDTLK